MRIGNGGIVCCALGTLAISTFTATPLSAERKAAESPRDSIVAIVLQIQKADYEGDRAALQRLYTDLAPISPRPGLELNDKLASRVLYWRGFALWRRALNGFNDDASPKDLEQDLRQALAEFDESRAKDPSFVDAKIGAGSCLSNLMFLNRKDPAQVQELLARSVPLLKQAEAEAPDNPRLLWVLGPNRWYSPPERGGGQDKAIATYQKGLDAIHAHLLHAHLEDRSDPLEPTWGEPELLMNLAWSNLNRTSPDLKAAESFAQAALRLVPNWHYVRDILIPQIRAAQTKAH
jgi:hypothetical protein